MMMKPDEFDRFLQDCERHVRNLGYVPDEFAGAQRFIPELGEPSEFIWKTTPARMRSIMPMAVQQAIEDAAILGHRSSGSALAEAARRRGGYGGLEDFDIPDQRHLLSDNDPLD